MRQYYEKSVVNNVRREEETGIRQNSDSAREDAESGSSTHHVLIGQAREADQADRLL